MFDISIIIVNYNVKDYIFKCINSILESEGNLNFEIIIVDNNSTDGSTEFIKLEYPNVKLIELKENIGFAKANNIGINISSGKYILLLNPDTIIEKNTLKIMYEFMESNPDIALSTCKVLNGDGTFQEACRRSFPTPISAFSKLFGLQNIFPKSKLLGRYNLSHLPIDETYEVEAVSGSFMFFKSNVLKEVGGFDPDFFMYGEDLDLCLRVRKKGHKIYYYPKTSIIHYKGESTKRSTINDNKEFYNAMLIYVNKHHSNSFLFKFFLYLGIYLRYFISYFFKYKKDIFLIIIDLSALAIGMMIGSKIIFNQFIGFPDYAYPNVFIIPQITLLFLMIIFGEYFEDKYTVAGVIYTYTITFLILSTLTYFFPAYRFSRGIVLFMTGFGLIISILMRLIILIIDKIKGKNQELRIAIIGDSISFNNLLKEFGYFNPGQYQFLGYINDYDNKNQLNWLGNLSHLEEIITNNKINNLIITDKTVNNENLLEKIRKLNKKIKIHFVNHFKDFVISKIIYDLIGSNNQIVIVKYNLFRYKLIKKFIDIIIPLFLILILIPFSIIKKIRKVLINLLNVLIGKKTLIGIYNPNNELKEYKHGLINFVDISKVKINDKETINKLNQYYVLNYSLSLDFDLLLRKILGI